MPVDAGADPGAGALIVLAPLGLDATTAAVQEGLDPVRTVAFDTLFPLAGARRRSKLTTLLTGPGWRDQAHALFAADGVPVSVLRDGAGFVAQRIVAMIVNTGCEIAFRQIAAPQDIDLAVTVALGYPMGPLALGDALGADTIRTILRNLVFGTGEPRYRPLPWLVRRAALGLSLTHCQR